MWYASMSKEDACTPASTLQPVPERCCLPCTLPPAPSPPPTRCHGIGNAQPLYVHMQARSSSTPSCTMRTTGTIRTEMDVNVLASTPSVARPPMSELEAIRFSVKASDVQSPYQ